MPTRQLVAAALLLVPFAAAAQDSPRTDPLVREGVTVQLGAHTYAIPDGNVGAVPNVGIIVGERGTLVIDPGLGRRNGETVLREVAKVSEGDELYIASTHFHPEHTTGYIAFPNEAQYVNSSIQETEFEENGQRMIELFAGRTPIMRDLLEDAERRIADITFDREYALDLGGVTVRMLVVGPTHTRGDTGFFVEEDAVLFAGDVVMNTSFLSANPGSSVTAWLAAFDAFEAMGPNTIVPAHGEIGNGTLIQTQRTIVESIRLQAHALKAEGRTADETANTIQADLVTQHPTWPRANGIGALARAAWAETP